MSNPQERMTELEEQIAMLKANWPAHSVQPWMLQTLEELEEELEAFKRTARADNGNPSPGTNLDKKNPA